MTGNSARSVYELQIVDASAPDRHDALFKSLVVSFLSLSSGNWEAFPAQVTVRIVDRRTNEIMWTRHTDPKVAHLFAVDIDENLDRLDAVAFASEWGIGPSA